MVEVYTTIVIISLVTLTAYNFHKNATNKIWSVLSNKYGCNSRNYDKSGKLEMIFFWHENAPNEIDYFNSMYISPSSTGILIYPPINNFTVKSILIPWPELSIDGTKYYFLRNRLKVKVGNTGVYISLLCRWKSEFIKYNAEKST